MMERITEILWFVAGIIVITNFIFSIIFSLIGIDEENKQNPEEIKTTTSYIQKYDC